MFFVLNLTRPGNSAVKLIDPDHPIIDMATAALPTPVPRDVTTPGTTAMTPPDWQTYYKKWQQSFDTGINNFIDNWYVPKENAI